MKHVLLACLLLLSTVSVKAGEPLRVNDWTLHAPFVYGFAKGLTFGLYELKKPQQLTSSTPSVAEMPIGLVPYVQQHNTLTITVGVTLGTLVTVFVLLSVGYGCIYRIRRLYEKPIL